MMPDSITNDQILIAFKPWRRVKPNQFGTNQEFLKQYLPSVLDNLVQVDDLDDDHKDAVEWKRVLKTTTVRLQRLAKSEKENRTIDRSRVSTY